MCAVRSMQIYLVSYPSRNISFYYHLFSIKKENEQKDCDRNSNERQYPKVTVAMYLFCSMIQICK
jgi:hypothetical protein